MKYHNKQKECKKAKLNGKGFCDYGKFEREFCICSKVNDLVCPFAWKINIQYNQ